MDQEEFFSGRFDKIYPESVGSTGCSQLNRKHNEIVLILSTKMQ